MITLVTIHPILSFIIFFLHIFSDVSHLFLIDPLVENLFDDEQWKDYWYDFFNLFTSI